jgi:hypothetical protein
VVSGTSRFLFEPVNGVVSGWLNRSVELDGDVVSGLPRFLATSVVSSFRFETCSLLVWLSSGWIDELDDAEEASTDMSSLDEDASPEKNPHVLGFFVKLTGPQLMEMARI